MTSASIAIIGAGLAGLTCARELTQAGRSVTVFEKARGPGGRLSSRRHLSSTFDLGAQELSAQHSGFAEQLRVWKAEGCLQPWKGCGDLTSWVGSPRMSALPRHHSKGLNLITATRITHLQATDDKQWSLLDASGKVWGPFTQVVLATPASQALSLIGQASVSLQRLLVQVKEDPVWVAYFALQSSSSTQTNCHQPVSSFLRRASLLNSKPGQESELQRWVVEATPQWSQQHLDLPKAEVARRLFNIWANDIATELPSQPHLLKAHRWLYGSTSTYLQQDFLEDTEQQLFVCGDFCQGFTAEAAWQSGHELGQVLRKTIQ
jgi:predicted NAD/FAD-dependent oxidoreductase